MSINSMQRTAQRAAAPRRLNGRTDTHRSDWGEVMKDSRIALPDGREFAYTELGDARGLAVFFFHGAPDSRLALITLESEFAARGLRLVSVDRPGYGGSSPQPGRTLADWPADVARLAAALGIDRFIVSAHSSGGPCAVVCAAVLPEVSGAVVLAGVTDMAWPAAWEWDHPEVAMTRMPDEQAIKARAEEMFGADGSGFFTAPGWVLPQPDEALLSDEGEMNAMLATIGEAFRQGVGGYAQDVFVQGHAWSFSPDRISVPVIVAHGL